MEQGEEYRVTTVEARAAAAEKRVQALEEELVLVNETYQRAKKIWGGALARSSRPYPVKSNVYRQMIAHLRERLARCQEHNRALAQETRQCRDLMHESARAWQEDLTLFREELPRLRNALHQDQTGLANALATVIATARGRLWILDGRGSYSWDDDRYRREAGEALQEIIDLASKALQASGNLAHTADGCRQRKGE